LRNAGGVATRVAAVLAAYNRRELTLDCLRSLHAQRPPGVTLDANLLDDTSSDSTSEAIVERFPEVTVLHSTGTLYWNEGMRRAFAAATAGDYDCYPWMNDDTRLDDGALPVELTPLRRRSAGRA
jgi:GT2 family glycosyltransferase